MAILEISCVEVWREISNYVDGEVSPDLRARLEEHFKGCAHCKAIVDGTSNVVKLVGDEKVFEVPQDFGKRLFKKFDSEILKK